MKLPCPTLNLNPTKHHREDPSTLLGPTVDHRQAKVRNLGGVEQSTKELLQEAYSEHIRGETGCFWCAEELGQATAQKCSFAVIFVEILF
ncbi:hypothetical protein PIIN_10319 [Serendipita indica DSM 11827]|uniref:Uncharacterized protein n=1 Tax=Serendipita indica (strain DSM 11827) TaxID=1109443 RepID=G4TYD1_SERID|nr:hypothetical protein PIIN_10319 [Serendipita indica DSM 11827]